jgi:di/tricarboxylate transporter
MAPSKNNSDDEFRAAASNRKSSAETIMRPRVFSRMQRMLRFVGRFGFVLALTGGTLALPTPEGLSPEGNRAAAAFIFTASILALEPVSLPIAALMVPVAEVALGVATSAEAFETFSRPVVFLILASLFLAEALRKHGLTRRLALATIVASGGGIGFPGRCHAGGTVRGLQGSCY